MINPLAVGTDGYITAAGLNSLTIASRGYLLADQAVVPEEPSAGGAGGVTRKSKQQAPVRIAKRITRAELLARKREKLEELEKQISVKTVRAVISKVGIEKLDLIALKQAIATARKASPPTVRKLVLDIIPGDITLPLVAPSSDLNLRLLLLLGV